MKNTIYTAINFGAVALSAIGMAMGMVGCGGGSSSGSTVATPSAYYMNANGQCYASGTNTPVAQTLCATNGYYMNGSQCYQQSTNTPVAQTYCSSTYGSYGYGGYPGSYGYTGYPAGYGYSGYPAGYAGYPAGYSYAYSYQYVQTPYGYYPQSYCPVGYGYYQQYICISSLGKVIRINH